MEALLRKYPKSQLVKVLKAFCAAHLNKHDVAETILADIIEEGPQDDRVLHTMTFVYKALGHHAGMLQAYKAAVEIRPLDPDIRIGLFGHYVRRLEYIQQQQESFKLAKIDPGNTDMYVWWSICSLVMQSCAAAVAAQSFQDPMVGKLLNLAHTMADQRLKKTKKVSFEKYSILCEILCGLGRHADALDLVLHFHDVCQDNVPDADVRMIVGTQYIRTGNFDLASKTFLGISMNNPQHWVAWHAYIATKVPELVDCSTLPLSRMHGCVAEVWDSIHLSDVWQDAILRQEISLEERISELRVSVDEMVEKYRDQRDMKRSLALARLEIAKYSSIQKKDMTILIGEIITCIPILAQYSSFGADLREYMGFLDEDHKTNLVKQGADICTQIAQDVLEQDGSIHGERRAFICKINGYMLQAEAGVGFADASEMISMYYQNVHLVKDFDPKDRGLGEELLVTAIAPLIQSKSKSWNADVETRLILGLLFIERAQMERTVSAPLRLAASAIYGLLGAQSLAITQFARLDIKGVIHDSLTGHWLLPILSTLCPTEEACKKWFDGIVNLHTVQEMEARDALFTAYEQQTLSKVPEFIDFIKCLNQSSTLYLYKSEKGILKLRSECIQCKPLDVHGHGENPRAKELIHNDDLTIRPFWYPPGIRGSILEVLSWWELEENTLSKRPMWWMHQDNQHSRERQAWESTTNHQIVSRLQLPLVLSTICSAPAVHVENIVVDWLEDAMEQIGIPLDIASPENICAATVNISSIIHETGTFSMIPDCLTAATILFGYHTHMYMSGTSDAEKELTTNIESLATSMKMATNRCIQMLKDAKPAGIILLARLSQEEFVWVAQVVRSFIRFCKDTGPWKHASDIQKELKKFAREFISQTLTVCTQHLCDAPPCLEYSALQMNPMFTQGLEFLEGFDVQEWLSKLTESQSSVRDRIKESLHQVTNMLEVFL